MVIRVGWMIGVATKNAQFVAPAPGSAHRPMLRHVFVEFYGLVVLTTYLNLEIWQFLC